MNSTTLVLSGTITAVSPLATCPPRTSAEKKSTASKTSRLPRMTLNGTSSVYFPASGIRGKLRRHAFSVIRSLVQGDGAPVFTIDDHYFNVLGGIKDKGDEDKADIVAAARMRTSNPLMSLFGSMAAHTAGKLLVGHAVPEAALSPVAINGVRSDDLQRSPENFEFLAPGELNRWETMARSMSQNSKEKGELKTTLDRIAALSAKVENEKASQEEREELEDLQDKKEELAEKVRDAGVGIQQPLAGFEAIPQGAALHHRFVLRNVTELEIGLFLAALEQLALDPIIGAHSARGCGVIAGSWTAGIRQGDQFVSAGAVELKPFKGLTVDAKLQAYRNAWDLVDIGALNFRCPDGVKIKSAA